MIKRIIFNGRFLAAPATGVQRVAGRLIMAVDARLSREGEALGLEGELYAPPGVQQRLLLTAIRFLMGKKGSGVLWEQFELVRQARRGLLVNLCNTGPVLTRNAITMIHDAQVYSTPQSYSFVFRLFYKCLQPLIARRHKLILTVSHYSKAQLVKYKVAPADKIEVIYNGVDHIVDHESDQSILSQFKLVPNTYVLSLASTLPHKNLRVLLDAFKQPELTGIRLVLFGGTSDKDLAKLCGGKIPENIVLVGKISDEALKALMQSALCLAFPSRTEGFGLPPLEAMYIGCPAVVAPCGALKETCGAAGDYADPDKPHEWVERIKALHDDANWRQTLSQRQRVHAQAYNWDAAAQKLITILRDKVA
jgi:glycosyltransferase involved in cell wall biosynthesis